jgi:predicted esterase
MLEALDDLDGLIEEADPPYDAILGFSQGSTLAATMLTRPKTDMQPPPFKLAVFLSAGMAADHTSLTQDEIRVLQHAKEGKDYRMISIPTAHIFADNDEVAPGQGRMLQSLCQESFMYSAVHRLGHRIPGNGDKKDLDAAVAAIRRAIASVN